MDVKRIWSIGGGYPFAVGAVAIITLIALPFRPYLATTTVMLLYVPAIILVARVSGVRPSSAAAVLSFLALDLVFIPPYYHLTVASLAEWIGLIVFLIVALVAGQQTGQLRERERVALQRQAELELLNNLSFQIAAEKSVTATAEYIVYEVTAVLGAMRAALYVRSDRETPSCLAEAGDAKASSGEVALVAWVMRNAKAVLPDASTPDWPSSLVHVSGSEAIPGVIADGVYLPLQTSDSLEGVLHARLDPDGAERSEPGLLVAVSNLAAASFERQRLAEDASAAVALAEADRLKATLVSSLSHELKTPLAAATARVTGLLDEEGEVAPSRVRDELLAVEEDLTRLDASIRDLLDLSRLESDAWRPHLEMQDIADVLGTVRSRISTSNRGRVKFELSGGLPLVSVDFAQLARALSIIVENALAYSPQESPVTVGARRAADAVEVWVEDEGPGVPEGEKEAVFEKFYRGSASAAAPGGTGLGLAIAKEIVRSHNASMRVEDVEPTGARFVVSLPVTPSDGGS